MMLRKILFSITVMITIYPVFSQDRVNEILSVIEKAKSTQEIVDKLSETQLQKRNKQKLIDPKLTDAERAALQKREAAIKNQYSVLSVLTGESSDHFSGLDGNSRPDSQSNTPLDILSQPTDQAENMIAMLDLTDAVVNESNSNFTILDKLINSTTGSATSEMNVLNKILDFTSINQHNSQTASHKGMFRYNHSHYNKSGSSNVGILPFVGSDWGRITSGFGYREKYQRMHKGIDIAMNVGDSVRCVMPGKVDRVNFERNGYGCYVVVKHDDGYETRYAHLSRCIVNPGDTIFAKQAIALSGNTGNSTGPHLHFEIRQNGFAIDPMAMFDFGDKAVPAGGKMVLDGNLADPLQYVVENQITTGFNGSKKQLTTKRTYIMRQGDTLRDIASRAGISLLELRRRNHLVDGQDVPVGTMLKLR